MWIFMIAYFIGIFVYLFAWIKTMDVFFGKRRTSLIVLILSCAPLAALVVGVVELLPIDGTLADIAPLLVQLLLQLPVQWM